jgi:WS/DGAT/MGAT family acyltransferase
MHVGAVAVFEPGPLSLEGGGFEIGRFERFVESVLQPRYRQRLAHMPVTRRPIWVDDPHFNLHYHVRHVSLPHPGDERQLKRLAGHVFSLPLDRNKPLWELWVVEGLPERRFAIFSKAHHCMVDGIASADLLTSTMSLSPETEFDEARPSPPRRAPGPLDLARGEARRSAKRGLSAVRAARDAALHPRRAFASLREATAGLGEAMAASAHQTSATVLNTEIGPHRRFDWLRQELAQVKAVKSRLGGTVNDVVLANAAGGLRRFLAERGEPVERLDFRAMVPVSIRAKNESGALGNRVATLAVELPLGEPEPQRRLERVIATTRAAKGSRLVHGMTLIEQISEWGLDRLFVELTRRTALTRPFNVVVTNVPGPQRPVYLLGAPLRAAYPLVPLYRNQALGIALFSYDGGLFWGLNADWDALPDLHRLVVALAADFEELRKAAGL